MPKTPLNQSGLEAILSGDMLAATRLIRRIEDGDPAARPLLKALYRRGGSARVIALTGAPGVGKSSLTDQLISAFRGEGKRVGVLAVDPTSPFTGGAILGDRIRMGRHFTDEGVFIRSMATRGHLGGLAEASGEAVQVLDAMGLEVILLETVGVGQAEVEVVHLADTVILVMEPGGGDDVQAAKAGIMEIAHIFAVNKARREGADRAVRQIEEMLNHSHEAGSDGGSEGGADGTWRPPVVKTEALDGEGISRLMEAIFARQSFLEAHPGESEILRLARSRQLLTGELKSLAAERHIGAREGEPDFEKLLSDIAERREDPYTAAERLLDSSG